MKKESLGKLCLKMHQGINTTADKVGYVNDGYHILQSKHITGGYIDCSDARYVDDDTYNKYSEKYNPQVGDILFCNIGTIGLNVVVNVKDDFLIAWNIFLLRPNSSLIDSNYLHYFLLKLHNQDYFSQFKTGGTVKFINKTELSSIQIPLPPLEEQKRIARILDKADEIRRKRKEAIRLTDELLRSTFLDMFGDPVLNPKGWDIVTIDDVVSEVKDGPHVSPQYSDEGIPILSTRNIRPRELVLDDIKYISQETYLDLVKRFKPQLGDVLLTKGGTTGFAKVVDWNWDFAVWVHLAVLRPKNNILPEFLEDSLNSPNCYKQSQKYTHGIANKDLGLTRIKKIILSLPPINLQEKYIQKRQIITDSLVRQKESLQESENLFNSLLQRAFKGEL